MIDSNKTHEIRYEQTSRGLVIHFSRNTLKNLFEDIDSYAFHCIKEKSGLPLKTAGH